MFKLLFITTLVLSGVVAKCESWEGKRGIVSNMLLVVVVGGGGVSWEGRGRKRVMGI